MLVTESGLAIYGPQDVIESDRVYAFDLDYTLIKPKSGNKHPVDANDWMWNDPKVPQMLRNLKATSGVVIFSNQAGIERKPSMLCEITKKLDNIYKEIGFDILTFISTGHNKWRKPSPCMFQLMIENYAPGVIPAECVYVGDAAGRDLDHSADDLKFAANCQTRFLTETDWYGGAIPIAVRCNNSVLGHIVPADYYDKQFADAGECVIMVGRPGSGKSTVAAKYFGGYMVINQDTVRTGAANARAGTHKQCLKKFNEYLMKGLRVIVDNTLPDKTTRDEYLTLAHKFKYRVTIIHMNVPEIVSKWLNKVRACMGGRCVPEVAYSVYNKKFIPVAVTAEHMIVVDKLPLDLTMMSEHALRLVF